MHRVSTTHTPTTVTTTAPYLRSVSPVISTSLLTFLTRSFLWGCVGVTVRSTMAGVVESVSSVRSMQVSGRLVRDSPEEDTTLEDSPTALLEPCPVRSRRLRCRLPEGELSVLCWRWRRPGEGSESTGCLCLLRLALRCGVAEGLSKRWRGKANVKQTIWTGVGRPGALTLRT